MSSFTPQTTITPVVAPDPFKHVNYALGMVLGVDDLTQEFAYQKGRDKWIVRDLVGFGTVCGLRVTIEEDGEGPQVVVSAGTAVSPRGQLIRVPEAQCARLNEWLTSHQTELYQYTGSPPGGEARLYVVLCYRECLTDMVPIPGEPCRSEDEVMAASRILDDYQLELRFVPPDQRHEDAIRDFVVWLRQVEVADVPDDPTLQAAFAEAIRQAVPQLSSPPTSPPTSPPDFILGSPPAAVVIPQEAVCDYMRLAFLLWTTELRPLWLGLNQTCAGVPPDEECVLLAEVAVPLTDAGQVADSPNVAVYEERRPYLLSLRMLQEWLLCGWHEQGSALIAADTVVAETLFDLPPDAGAAAEYSRADHTHGTPPNPIPPHQADPNAHNLAGDVTGVVSNTVVERIRGLPVSPAAPADSQVLTFQGGQWQPADLPPGGTVIAPADTVVAEVIHGQSPDAGTAAEYSRADHTHGTPPDPIPPHQAALDAHTLAGDITGNIGATTVQRIRNLPVDIPGTAQLGDVLTFQGTQWQVRAITSPPVSGDFVEHPPGLPRYAIVAAGIVRGDTSARDPVYNNLTAQTIADCLLMVQFDDYQEPDRTFQYIVKVLLVDAPDTFPASFGITIPTVTFNSFQSDHFLLNVWASSLISLVDSNGAPILDPISGEEVTVPAAPVPVNREILGRMEFMIEVSWFLGQVG